MRNYIEEVCNTYVANHVLVYELEDRGVNLIMGGCQGRTQDVLNRVSGYL